VILETLVLVRPKSLRLSSSDGLGWKNIVMERHLAEPGERSETSVDEIFLELVCGRQLSHGERLNRLGRPEQYFKEPGTIFLFSEGVLPVIRPSTKTELLACVLNRTFVREISEELNGGRDVFGARPGGFPDSALNSLMVLLEQEATSGGQSGQLYVDHLAYAVGLRLLSLGMKREDSQNSINELSGLRLRRVIDRMQAALSSNLDLKTLAMESGYSRNHFLRMFRAATGYTPHQYLLRLRLKRAQEMMKNRSMNLVDIALECGFSSHSHLVRVFRHILGAAPSEYRRDLL
jgi:AraC family transcriptional regulator